MFDLNWTRPWVLATLGLLLAMATPGTAGDFGLTPPCSTPTSAELIGIEPGDIAFGQPGLAVPVNGLPYDFLVSGTAIPLLQLQPPQAIVFPFPRPQPLPLEYASCTSVSTFIDDVSVCESNCSYQVQELEITSQSTGASLLLTEADRVGINDIFFRTGVRHPIVGDGFEWLTSTVPDGIYTIQGRAFQDPLTLDFECTKCFWNEVLSNTVTVRVLNNSVACNPPSAVHLLEVIPTGSGSVSPHPTDPASLLVSGTIRATFTVDEATSPPACDFGTLLRLTNLETGRQSSFSASSEIDTALFDDGLYALQAAAFPTGNAFFELVASDPLVLSIVNEAGPPPEAGENDPINQLGDVYAADPTDLDAIQGVHPGRPFNAHPRSEHSGDPPSISDQFGADPVNLVTGGLFAPELDASFPAIGHTVSLWRYYNSGDGEDRPFGIGWSFLYDRSVRLTLEGKLIERDGRGVQFAFSPDGAGGFLPATGYEGRASQDAGEFSVRHARGTTYRYALSGELLSITDASGNALTFAYSDGVLASLSAPGGRQVLFSNDGAHITAVTLPDGETHAYQYDGTGRLVAHVDPLGNTTTYTYGPGGLLGTITRPSGATTAYLFTGGRVTQVVDPGGGVNTLTYDLASRLTLVTDRAGAETRVRYDVSGNITQRTDPLGAVESRSYDTEFRITRITDPRGATSRFTYDAVGNVTQVSDPLGNITSITIDPVLARPTSITGPRAQTTIFEYDGFGNLTALINPVGDRFEVAYEARGLPLELRDFRGNLTRFEYDANGGLSAVIDPAGNRSEILRDALGRPLRLTDPLGRSTQVEYLLGRLPSRIIDPLGQVTSYTYDADLNPVVFTRSNGASTSFTYGQFGFQTRVTALTDALDNVTRFEYDAAGRLERVLDPLGQALLLAHDAAGRLIRVTDPLGQVTRLTYDANGNVATASSAGNQYVFTYDALDRLTRRTGLLGGVVALDEAFTFDAAGNRLSFRGSRGGLTTYTYNLASQLTRLVSSNPGDATGLAFDFAYDSGGRLAQKTYPNGTAALIGYDAAGRVTSFDNISGRALLSQHRYTHDPVGNVLSVFDEVGGLESYTYDALHRLVRAVVPSERLKGGNPGTRGPPAVLDFAYDPTGNRISKTVDGVASFATYDAANRLLQTGLEQFTYDRRGNLLSRISGSDELRLTYSVANQLRTATTFRSGRQKASEAYGYDAFGARTRIEGARGARVDAFDGLALAESFDVSAQGRVGDPLRLVRDTTGYVLLQHAQGSGPDLFHYQDALGSTTALGTASGGAKSRYQYSPFGELVQGNDGATPILFAGMQHDDLSGFAYSHFRHYDPAQGRWTSREPLGFLGGPNLYLYALDNPATFTDPSGLLVGVDDAAALALAALAGGTLSVGVDVALSKLQGREITRQSLVKSFALGATFGGIGKTFTGARAVLAALAGGTTVGTAVDAYFEPPCDTLDLAATAGRNAAKSAVGLAAGAAVGRIARAARPGLNALTRRFRLPGPVPGVFPSTDVVLGLAAPGGKVGALTRFAGAATPGTQAPLSPSTFSLAAGSARNHAIAADTLRFAGTRLQETGGRLGINLEGLNLRAALNPASSHFNSVTSIELRGVLNDPFLRDRARFFLGGVDVTARILGEIGF